MAEMQDLAWDSTIVEFVFDAKFHPSVRWRNIAPGVVYQELKPLWSDVSIRPRFDSFVSPVETTSPLIPTPWTFMVHTGEGFEIGVNQNSVVAWTRPAQHVKMQEMAETFVQSVKSYVRLEQPTNFARIAIQSTHRLWMDARDVETFKLGTIFELQPRTGTRFPATNLGFGMEVRFVHEAEHIVSSVSLETDGIDEENARLLFLLKIDCATMDDPVSQVVSGDDLENWLQSTFTVLQTDYLAVFKPNAVERNADSTETTE